MNEEVKIWMNKNGFSEINAVNNMGETPLMVAVDQNNPYLVDHLIDAGADLNAQNFGETALMLAISGNRFKDNDFAIIGHLIYNMDVDKIATTLNEEGKNALIVALELGNLKAVDLLIAVMSPDQIAISLNEKGENALVAALELGYEDIAKLLVEKMDVNDIRNAKNDFYEQSALILANNKGFVDVVKAIQDKFGVVSDVSDQALNDNPNRRVSSPALEAQQNIDKSIALKILSEDYEIHFLKDRRDTLSAIAGRRSVEDIYKKENTALIEAIRLGEGDEVKSFFDDKRTDFNLQGEGGMTALMWAAAVGDNDTTKLLIDRGADVNAVNDDDRSALIIAAAWGNDKVVNELLATEGIDLTIQDNDGKTVFDYAEKNCDKSTIDLLKEKMEVAKDRSDSGLGFDDVDSLLSEIRSVSGASIGSQDSGRGSVSSGGFERRVSVAGGNNPKKSEGSWVDRVVKQQESTSKSGHRSSLV